MSAIRHADERVSSPTAEESAPLSQERPQGGGADEPWFYRVDPEEAWIAYTDGFGAGFFKCGRNLDPQEFDWEPVPWSEVLDVVSVGREGAPALLGTMLAKCLTDGDGSSALQLADELVGRGYRINVTITS